MSQDNEWMGSIDPVVTSGTAIFRVGDSTVTMELRSFRDFHAICHLLAGAREVGASQARETVATAVRRALKTA